MHEVATMPVQRVAITGGLGNLATKLFCQLATQPGITKAILTDSSAWPDGYLLVNGMSANRGMKWNLAATRRWLGYVPQDNVWGEC